MNELFFQLANTITDTLREPVVILDAAQRVITANRRFCQTFGCKPEELEQRYIYELGGGQWKHPALRSYLEQAAQGAEVGDLDMEYAPNGSHQHP